MLVGSSGWSMLGDRKDEGDNDAGSEAIVKPRVKNCLCGDWRQSMILGEVINGSCSGRPRPGR